MIRVEATLIPGGVHVTKKQNLGYITIANDGTGTPKHGNYKVRQYSRGKNPRLVKELRIENWPRGGKTAWKLVAEAFKRLEEDT